MYDVVPANTDQTPATHPDNIQRGLRQRWVLFSMRPRLEGQVPGLATLDGLRQG
ncbi:MAG: hypothetical protein V3T08_04455 [Gemmatimonadota bacterium]